MAIKFDGKIYSESKKVLLSQGSLILKQKGIIPHLATIVVGDDKSSKQYVNLKKKYIESLLGEVDTYFLKQNTSFEDLKTLIISLNDDKSVHGIMIQLPLPDSLKSKRSEVISLIDPKKDVDGLQLDSLYLHPTSKAVLEIFSLAVNQLKLDNTILKILVVGSSGMVGRPLVKELKKMNMEVLEADIATDDMEEKISKADVIISATGKMNLIDSANVKSDVILIDVGFPFADIAPSVVERSSFYTPVPGGVGPVTISCLAENLISAAS